MLPAWAAVNIELGCSDPAHCGFGATLFTLRADVTAPYNPTMFVPTSLRSSSPAQRLLPWAAGLAVALVAVVLAWLWAGGLSGSREAGESWSWLPMLPFGAVCAVAGGLWINQQSSGRLREARMGQQQLLQLVDAWVWQSDPLHRITMWRPPHDAPVAAWLREAPIGARLWERFEILAHSPQVGALRARLESQATLADLRVQQEGDDAPTVWRLQAIPQFDADGRFSGYVGTVKPLADDDRHAFEHALLARLLPAPGLAAVALRPVGADGWVIGAVSDEAARLLKLDPASLLGQDWGQVRAHLPTDLATVADELAPGQSRDVADWTVELQTLPGGLVDDPEGAGRLLLWRTLVAPVVADPGQLDEHESFTYSVSHDLRAPIRVVDGFARILKEDYGRFLDRIGNDHLERVLAAAARMNSMIDALLALSRLQSQPLQRKPVDLSQLATFIMEDLRRENPERAAEVDIEPGIVVLGDPTLLRIAMENLLGNAWKYSGQCAVTRIGFRSEQRDGRTVWVVSDQGAGFDMRFADRLFGVFQRLHSPKDFQGTGVGLASVRRILRRHGGDIWAEAEVGKGARFYFSLAV
jgi:signal transduction histidine kinase